MHDSKWLSHHKLGVISTVYALMTVFVVYQSLQMQNARNDLAVAYYADFGCRDVIDDEKGSLCHTTVLTITNSSSGDITPGIAPSGANRVYRITAVDSRSRKYTAKLYDGFSYDGDSSHDAEPVVLRTGNLATGSKLKAQIFNDEITLFEVDGNDIATAWLPRRVPMTAGPQETLLSMLGVYVIFFILVRIGITSKRIREENEA